MLPALRDPGLFRVRLQYGFLYDSFRRRFYFWECIILLEKLALVLSVTLLQQVSSSSQVLVAMAIVFLAFILQVRCDGLAAVVEADWRGRTCRVRPHLACTGVRHPEYAPASALQITCQPYACRLLDTMQRASLYVLQGTLFLVMMAAINPENANATLTAAVIIIGAWRAPASPSCAGG